jgi:hypothetical protein
LSKVNHHCIGHLIRVVITLGCKSIASRWGVFSQSHHLDLEAHFTREKVDKFIYPFSRGPAKVPCIVFTGIREQFGSKASSPSLGNGKMTNKRKLIAWPAIHIQLPKSYTFTLHKLESQEISIFI